MDIDYGGWLTEDLKSLYDDILRDRNRCEDYSDRQQLNMIATKILAALQKRNYNYCPKNIFRLSFAQIKY